MKSRKKGLLTAFLTLVIGVVTFVTWGDDTEATYHGYLDTLNAGAALIIDADISMADEQLAGYVRSINSSASNDDELITTGLVMANVKNVLNIRQEPSEDSEKIGKLYSDCGGTILERRDGWTKIETGNLIGWAKDEYLLYGQEAEDLAKDVGMMMAEVITEGLRVRKEPSTESGTYGFLNHGDVVEVIEIPEDNSEWVTVDYEGQTAYIFAEYISVDLIVDHGETIEEYKERKAAEEAEEKAIRKAGYKDIDAYTEGMSDVELLAALVYCEAGNQSDEGKLAVAAVVMNRLNSNAYPDTLRGVIGASGQFSPVASGFLKKVITTKKVPQSCYDAAQKALDGETNIGSAMHFRRTGSREGTIIGDHVFW